jgi:cell division protein FtsW (lipid II flippase)
LSPRRRGEKQMNLLTAHKILISSAVVFFVFLAFWEYRNYASGDGWAVWRSCLYFIVALGFGVYLKNLKRWYK